VTSAFSESFVRMAEPHAAWGMRQVEEFNGFLPVGPWSVNLDERIFRQSQRELGVSVLGSFDTVEGSWLWGWANPGFGTLPAVAAAETLRAFGAEHGISEFEQELVDLSGFPDPRYAAEMLAFGAMGVLRADGYIGVQANETGRLYMVPDDPQVPIAGPDLVALPRLLMSGAQFYDSSAFEVTAGYFHHFDLPWHDEGDRVLAEFPDGTAVVSFDDKGRIVNVSAEIRDDATAAS
jgi:hypothetical protein